MSRKQKVLVFFCICLVVLALMAGRLIWPFSTGLGEGYAVVQPDELRKLFPVVVDQINTTCAILQTLAVGLIVVVGFTYKEILSSPKKILSLEILMFSAFVICELVAAYFSYWTHITAIAELSLGYLNGSYLQNLIAYQASAVLLSALCALAIVLLAVVPDEVRTRVQ